MKVRDYIFEELLSAVAQTIGSSSDMSWPSLSKVPPPLSKEGTGVCIGTCKKKFFMHENEKNRSMYLVSTHNEKSSFFLLSSHCFGP
jgi:hypothetical protein